MSEHFPLLSIVVPVYNVEPYLRRCIDSILAQTFTDFELILVDDGSPDGCGMICDTYAQQDPRIRVIHKENGGLSDARNAGLDIAQGRYIGFIDSDDTVSPHMYERLIFLLEHHDADIASTGFQNLDQNREILARYPQLSQPKVYHREDYIQNFYPDIKWEIYASACNKLYRRSIFDHLRYPVGKLYEDSFIQLPLYDLCDTIVVDNEHHYHYYVTRDSSIMNTGYSAKRFQLIDLSLSQYDFFVDKAIRAQQDYALATYATNYMINFFAVYIGHPELTPQFLPYRKHFRKFLPKLLSDPYICKMKKLTIMIMYLNNKVAYRLCRKYFPESLPEFLRIEKD